MSSSGSSIRAASGRPENAGWGTRILRGLATSCTLVTALKKEPKNGTPSVADATTSAAASALCSFRNVAKMSSTAKIIPKNRGKWNPELRIDSKEEKSPSKAQT